MTMFYDNFIAFNQVQATEKTLPIIGGWVKKTAGPAILYCSIASPLVPFHGNLIQRANDTLTVVCAATNSDERKCPKPDMDYITGLERHLAETDSSGETQLKYHDSFFTKSALPPIPFSALEAMGGTQALTIEQR